LEGANYDTVDELLWIVHISFAWSLLCLDDLFVMNGSLDYEFLVGDTI
jgi:hypothetical protein